MRDVRRTVVIAVALMLLAAPHVVWAQSNVATGQIQGTVTDPDGGVLPGATVAASNPATGLTRRAVTDAGGFFRIDLLPSAKYDVRVDLAGFKSEVKTGVNVTLGSMLIVDFGLQLSAIEEEIVVTAEAPVVETTNPNVASSVSDEAIANLPLNGRDFLDFLVLTPGAVAGSTDEVDGGRGGVNINGSRGIQNSFNIDGANSQSSFFGEERGGTRPPFTFSQAAIKEFQVINSSYATQFSNASGGVVNAVTKSGTNELSGEVFFYYRPDSFVGDYADQRESSDFERNQYGFAIGGPIVRDKVHFFGSYDGQKLDQPTFREFRNFPEDRTADFEALTGLDMDTEVGNILQTNDNSAFLVKLDWQVSDSHLLTLRDNYNDQSGENLTNNYSTAGLSTNGLEENTFNSFVATLNSVISQDAFNEFIFQWAVEERPRTANNTEIPEVRIGSSYYANFGQNQFLPNFLDENRIQLIDNFTYYAGDHTLKGGVNFDLVSYKDGFCRYCEGQYYYRSYDQFFEDDLYRFTQAFSETNGTVDYDTNYYSFYVQDDWRASSNLTVTYGLRYDLQDHDDPKETNPLFPLTGQIPDDTNNWSPRVGFAWDINGDGKQVLRGGIGKFYDNSPTLLDANAMLTNGIRVIRVTQNCTRGDTCPEWPSLFGSIDDVPFPRPDLFFFSPNFENPETTRLSLGYEREVMTDLSLGVDVIYSESKKLERKKDLNLAPDGGTTPDGRPTYDSGANDGNFYKLVQFTSDAEAEYTAIILKGRKRFSNGWMFDASYTYSDAEDNDSNERSVSTNSGFPEDQYNLNGSWGPANFDVTHKFVASATVMLPYDFMLSGILNIRSGFPYTAGDSRDVNGDGYFSDRALIETSDGVYYHYPRNSERQPSFRSFDMRLSKSFNLGRDYEIEIIGEVFNLTDEDNWITDETSLVNWWDDSINEDFGTNTISGQPRQFQLGAKFRF